MAGVVLAAGAGSRYGRPKILAEQGRWLELAVAALMSCDAVWVTTGAARPPLPAPAREIYVPTWAKGASESVRAAITVARDSGCDTLVLLTVDTPDVSPAVVIRVLSQHTADPGLTRATYDGRPGHPVVIDKSHWDRLASTLSGDTGARAYLADHGTRLVECGDIATGTDIDHHKHQPD